MKQAMNETLRKMIIAIAAAACCLRVASAEKVMFHDHELQ